MHFLEMKSSDIIFGGDKYPFISTSLKTSLINRINSVDKNDFSTYDRVLEFLSNFSNSSKYSNISDVIHDIIDFNFPTVENMYVYSVFISFYKIFKKYLTQNEIIYSWNILTPITTSTASEVLNIISNDKRYEFEKYKRAFLASNDIILISKFALYFKKYENESLKICKKLLREILKNYSHYIHDLSKIYMSMEESFDSKKFNQKILAKLIFENCWKNVVHVLENMFNVAPFDVGPTVVFYYSSMVIEKKCQDRSVFLFKFFQSNKVCLNNVVITREKIVDKLFDIIMEEPNIDKIEFMERIHFLSPNQKKIVNNEKEKYEIINNVHEI